jgi:hypothetical protein|tara:strand:+ start:1099 stop:1332 length:234 start_codon:yes stop_codon:yes gene_type:complete
MINAYTIWESHINSYFISNFFGRIVYAKREVDMSREADMNRIPWEKYECSKNLSKIILNDCTKIKELTSEDLILELM